MTDWADRARRAENLLREIADSFDPFLTAWEASDVWTLDGVDLMDRVKALLRENMYQDGH